MWTFEYSRSLKWHDALKNEATSQNVKANFCTYYVSLPKREKPVFLSVKVGGNPTRKEAEDIAGIWETGLWNNHVHADRFMMGDDTAAYLFKVRIM